MMKFSVLIAHYNNSVYFKDCYDSIMKQTYPNWEAIILDDGSRTEEKDAVKRMIAGDSRFIFFENGENMGVGKTKSKLGFLANGEICAFVDPDDALKPDALQSLINRYTSEEITAVYSRFMQCDEHLNEKKIFSESAQVANGSQLFFNIFFEMNHLFSFRKSAYEKCGGIDETLSSSVDQDLYLKIYDIGKVIFIRKPLYLYRQHKQGVSQDADKKKKLYENWHHVLKNTAQRRNLKEIYGKNIDDIENLPQFLFSKQNTLLKKIKRRLK